MVITRWWLWSAMIVFIFFVPVGYAWGLRRDPPWVVLFVWIFWFIMSRWVRN